MTQIQFICLTIKILWIFPILWHVLLILHFFAFSTLTLLENFSHSWFLYGILHDLSVFVLFHSCIFIKTCTSPINDIRVFVGVTTSTLPFQDVVKRPFKGFVFYHKIEKKRKKHNRISTPLNHLAHILK